MEFPPPPAHRPTKGARAAKTETRLTSAHGESAQTHWITKMLLLQVKIML